MAKNELFEAQRPWPVSDAEGCFFYHSMDFPDGTSVAGHWDIRGYFDEYVGRYPLAGKTLLDVGTATGFLAFSAESAGARVTALDIRGSEEFRRVPFRDSLYHRDRAKFVAEYDVLHVHGLKKAFWYSWHKLNSKVEVVYAPLDQLHAWDRRFDVVMAGAIIEHLSDPVTVIGELARLADEAVIIPFTEVIDSNDWTMHANGDWSNPALDFLWWRLSRGLYYRVFENLGFKVEMVMSRAAYNPGVRRK